VSDPTLPERVTRGRYANEAASVIAVKDTQYKNEKKVKEMDQYT
jgi:hypothetical protein